MKVILKNGKTISVTVDAAEILANEFINTPSEGKDDYFVCIEDEDKSMVCCFNRSHVSYIGK